MLNSTAREALYDGMQELPEGTPCLFRSRKSVANEGGDSKLQPITDRALGYVVANYMAVAEVEEVSPQNLSHHFGNAMASRMSLYRLAQIMGHHSFGTTMVYVQDTRGDLRHAVEEIAWA